jgi:acetyltransferase-like isoleucine patch superfamily enzyme
MVRELDIEKPDGETNISETPMTILSRIWSVFPAMVIMLALGSVGYWVYHPGPPGAIALLASLYGVPPLVYRLHAWRYPIKPGISYLGTSEYSPWWGSHQIQVIYISFPALEAALRLIPGAFSLWLRLWGASIGRHVYWTPGLDIADRGLLSVGDRAVFGHRVELYAHAIKPKHNDLMLYVKPITIGSHTFVGAGTRIGPGVVIDDGAYIPAKTDIHPRQHIPVSTFPPAQPTDDQPSCDL